MSICLVLAMFLNGGSGLEYFPLNEGSKWHYRMEIPNRKSAQVETVARRIVVDGMELICLETSLAGKVRNSTEMSVKPNGIFVHSVNGARVSRPYCFLKFPVAFGDSWEEEFVINGAEIKASFRIGREQFELPTGEVDALYLEIFERTKTWETRTKHWFAPNLGIIGARLPFRGDNVTFILEKYQKGSKSR
jgi:hypothetical protein